MVNRRIQYGKAAIALSMAAIAISLAVFSGWVVEWEALSILACWMAWWLYSAERETQQSERLFSEAFEHAPTGVAVLSLDGRWLKVNRALTELLGYSAKELLGRSYTEVTHPDDLAACAENVGQVVTGKIPFYQSEKRYVDNGGKVMPVAFIISSVRDADGQPLYLIAQIQDVTGRRAAEQEVRFSEQRYRSLVEALSAIVWNTAASGQFEEEQPSWTAFTGQSFEELRGLGWLEAVHPDDRIETGRTWAAAVETRSIYKVEHRLRASDQTYHDMMVRAVPILAADGTIREFIGIHRDITQQKRAAEELAANENLLRLFIEHTPVAIAMLDRQMCYIQASERWLQDYHLTGQDIIGKSHYDIFPDVSPLWGEIHQRVLAGAVEKCDVDSFRQADGSLEWLQWEARPWRNADNEIGGLIFFTQIITQRIEAERELRWKTAFLEAQVNSSIDGILVVDQDGKKTLQNQQLIEMLGIPPSIADDKDDSAQLQWVKGIVVDPAQFAEKVIYLNNHRNEVSRDEIALKNGQTLDRYSSPMVGSDGVYYGRIWTFHDVTERVRTEQSLRLLGSAVEQSNESIVITDAEFELPGPRIVFVNPAFTRMTGYTAEEVLGQSPRILQGARTDRAVLDRLRCNLEKGKSFEGQTINYRKNGEEFDLEWQIAPICAASGKATHLVAIQRDITERKRIEAQLFESQKMETVGKLAGGVAHEFNSIMTAIIGRSELLLGDLPAREAPARNVAEIRRAAERAAALTRQLLAYGRKQILSPEMLDLNRVIREMEDTLRHLMKENIHVQFAPATNLKAVKADLGQIQQVIMNMAMNAADAMPDGGVLTMETENVTLEADDKNPVREAQSGGYVTLTIADSGAGMSEEVKARVFEPFFTTKSIGQGVGLGLSTCYGIIKQSGGHVLVISEPGRGAMFKIYLPQVAPETRSPIRPIESSTMARGEETILLVEDDPALRDMAANLLRRLGYKVMAAANGLEALSRDTRDVDLLFSDVMMPQMNGKELAERLKALHPKVKILFTSSFTDNSIVHQGGLNKGVALLKKPYTPTQLATKVREALNQTEVGPGMG